MKQFIYKTVLFIIMPPVFFALVYFFNLQRRNNYIQDIAINNEVIIMGDSQIQKINPDYFKQKTFNFSSIGETYNVTYYKLNKIFSQKENNIKTVIIGASVHNFTFDSEKRYDIKTPEGKYILRKNIYYMNLFNDHVFPFKYKLVEKLFYSGILRSPKYSGYGASTNENPTKDIIDFILNRHYDIRSDVETFNQEEYFNKIITLCKKMNVRIIITSTPYHNYYKDNIPEYDLNKFNSFIKSYNNVTYFNYLNDKTPDSLFSDGNHLNIKGGNRYAKKMSQSL